MITLQVRHVERRKRRSKRVIVTISGTEFLLNAEFSVDEKRQKRFHEPLVQVTGWELGDNVGRETSNGGTENQRRKRLENG